MTTATPAGPIPIIQVDGTNAELGHAVGHRLRGRIQQVADETRQGLSTRGVSLRSLRDEQAPYVEHVADRFPHLLGELQALADAADVPFEVLFWLNSGGMRTPLSPGNASRSAAEPDGCTSVASRGPNGTVVGHNEDAHPQCIDDLFLIDARISPEGISSSSRFVGLCYAYTLAGCAASMNGHGLIALVDSLQDPDPQPGVPCDFLTRAVLEQPSIEAAIDCLEDSRRSGAVSLLLAQGDALVNVELTSKRLVATDLRSVGSYAHTNHFVSGELMRACPAAAIESAARRERASELAEAGMGVDRMKRLLCHRTGTYHDVCRERTIGALVASSDRPGVEVCLGPPDGGTWTWHGLERG
ncbi:MAG TPA: C45 family peptidase [Pirellulales bacterium]|nr:C45 family peptidase [Pirellulales bacterium]